LGGKKLISSLVDVQLSYKDIKIPVDYFHKPRDVIWYGRGSQA
jgi:hypothetical protein